MFPNKEIGISDEYLRYFVCRKMGWDFFTYSRQPSFFIAEILDCIEAEEIVKQLRNNKNGGTNKS